MSEAVNTPDKPGDRKGESSPDNGERLTKSHVFDLLSADRRQEVLRYLDRNDGTADLGEVAEHIASQECSVAIDQLNSQQRKRVYVGLYQCHLPKMADAGVIDYDPDRGDIALNERSARLLNYLYFEDTDPDGHGDGLLERFLR